MQPVRAHRVAKNKRPQASPVVFCLVGQVGVEPTRLSATDFKSVAYTIPPLARCEQNLSLSNQLWQYCMYMLILNKYVDFSL